MATALTADAMLAALKKWGIAPKFYQPDWRTHNRNAAQGFGPINGFVVHNFGSDTSDPNSLAYLYRGDAARKMPGPLSQFAITDDGQVWVIGWGSANHTGYMETGLHALVQKDAAPLDRDYRPSTTDGAGIGRVNPHYLGVEMTYGKAPTAAQRKSVALLGAALMDALGSGYTGGSVVGHRECTKVRSDPVGIPMWQLRRDINALLKAGPAGTPTATPAPAAPEDDMFSDADRATLRSIEQALAGFRSEEKDRYSSNFGKLNQVLAAATIDDSDVAALATKVSAALPASGAVSQEALTAAIKAAFASLAAPSA